MPASADESRRLRDLHEEYVWRVNAAVERNRYDLVRALGDDYLDRAVEELRQDRDAVCARPACMICTAARHRRPRREPLPARLWHFLLGAPPG